MYHLTMKYKGDRNYLHGTDFFNEIERVMQEEKAGWLKKLAFRKFSVNQCGLLQEKPSNPKSIVASGTWQLEAGEAIPFWIIESSRLVNQRSAFDESDLLAPAKINKNKISLNVKNNFSTIENIVTLTKHINYHISPNVAGKWVFGQIDLDSILPASFHTLTIERISEIKNKFSLNSIEVNGKKTGSIRFISGQP